MSSAHPRLLPTVPRSFKIGGCWLSRLLVPDLRPVFDLIAPLLGKQRQKAFVSRFAAEALSFLIRRAGAGHHRDQKPLQLILRLRNLSPCLLVIGGLSPGR
jgi:hypothetical protein